MMKIFKKNKKNKKIINIVDTEFYNIIVSIDIVDKDLMIFKDNTTDKKRYRERYSFTIPKTLNDRSTIEIAETIKWEIVTTFMKKYEGVTLWEKLKHIFKN